MDEAAVVVVAVEIAHEIVDDEWEASAVDYYCDIASSSLACDDYCYFDYDYDNHSIDFDSASNFHYYSPILLAAIDWAFAVVDAVYVRDYPISSCCYCHSNRCSNGDLFAHDCSDGYQRSDCPSCQNYDAMMMDHSGSILRKEVWKEKRRMKVKVLGDTEYRSRRSC